MALPVAAASTLYDPQARDLLEVANVAGNDPKAELQGGRGDEQILERDCYAVGGLIALYAPGDPCSFDGDRVYWTSRVSSSTKA